MAIFSVRPTMAQADVQWAGPYIMALTGIRASFRLFNGAWIRVMRSPTGWHDRTPVGPHSSLLLTLDWKDY